MSFLNYWNSIYFSKLCLAWSYTWLSQGRVFRVCLLRFYPGQTSDQLMLFCTHFRFRYEFGLCLFFYLYFNHFLLVICTRTLIILAVRRQLDIAAWHWMENHSQSCLLESNAISTNSSIIQSQSEERTWWVCEWDFLHAWSPCSFKVLKNNFQSGTLTLARICTFHTRTL